MNLKDMSSSALHMMLENARSSLAIDDRRGNGNELYFMRHHPDCRNATRAIELVLSGRDEVFVPIAW